MIRGGAPQAWGRIQSVSISLAMSSGKNGPPQDDNTIYFNCGQPCPVLPDKSRPQGHDMCSGFGRQPL
eukprot:scaffold411945_cov48-Prasinocladus_malaysianus.AAC.1